MKNRYVLLADLPLILIAAFGAFAGRFDWGFISDRPEFPLYVGAALVVKPVVFRILGMYHRYWQYASIQEMLVIIIAVTAASVAMAGLVLLTTTLAFVELTPVGVSRVVIFNDWLLTLALTGGFRLAVRAVNESTIASRGPSPTGTRQRILIVGAGAAGTMVAREMRRNPQLGMDPIGYLDDDKEKIGTHIGGLGVLGDLKALPEVVRSKKIDNVIIAMPTAGGPAVRAILDICGEAGVKSQTVPGVFELLGGRVSVSRLRNIDIADLLRRSPVEGPGNTAAFTMGRVVLITGGGGSIGFELARQIAVAGPAQLILLGHGENSIFEADARLRASFPTVNLTTVIADVRDDRRLAQAFDRLRPSIVFHAAAHKHVPLMEDNPEEAVTNNIIGTRNVVNQALRAGTERFVLISTDKAVAPSSLMGATKRVAETIVRQAAQKSGRAFVAVRFGNVLGSRGSVVNTFKTQIEQGGPVTVTHAEMTRFFMTIPEAVHLVLQASGIGKGGELFVLDMGEPIRIVDLAQDLIRLSGYSLEEMPIVFTGVRPGEKMGEILFDAGMETVATIHPEVLQVVGPDTAVRPGLDSLIDGLQEAALLGDRPAILRLLSETIPGFVGRQRSYTHTRNDH